MNLRTAKVSNYQFQDLLQPMLPSELAETCDNPHLDQRKQLNTSLISTDQNHGFSGHPISPGLTQGWCFQATFRRQLPQLPTRPLRVQPAPQRLIAFHVASGHVAVTWPSPGCPVSIGRNLVKKKGEFGNLLLYNIVHTYSLGRQIHVQTSKNTHTHIYMEIPPILVQRSFMFTVCLPHLLVEWRLPVRALFLAISPQDSSQVPGWLPASPATAGGF